MKLLITTEKRISLARVLNTMVMILMSCDEMNAEQAFSNSLGPGSTIYEFDIQMIDDQNRTKCDHPRKEKNEVIHDEHIKVADLIHQDPVIKQVSLSEKNWHLNSNWGNILGLRKNVTSNQHDLNGINQIVETTKNVNDFLPYLKKEITFDSYKQKNPNKLRDKIIINSFNHIVNIPSNAENYNKHENNKTPKLLKKYEKQTDKILKTRYESEKVMRKLRQIDQAESTLTINNNINYKTLYQINPNKLFKWPNDVANENVKIVKKVSGNNDSIERIINSNPKFNDSDSNENLFNHLVEKRPINCYNNSRSSQTNKSASRSIFKDKILKQRKSTAKCKIKKYCKNDTKRRKTTLIQSYEKNKNINESKNIKHKTMNKIRNKYKPNGYRTRSSRARHKLPYAKMMHRAQDISKDTYISLLFNSSHHNQKLENIDVFNQTTSALEVFYEAERNKLLRNNNNQGDGTTQRVLDKMLSIRQSAIVGDEEADEDDDDLIAFEAVMHAKYDSYNHNHNNNDDRYEHYTNAVTNENNVNNVIVINFRTTRHVPTVSTEKTCPPIPGEPVTGPTLKIVRDEYVMDQNLLMATLFTSMIILIIASCCCTPFVLIRRKKRSRYTQEGEGLQDYVPSECSDTI